MSYFRPDEFFCSCCGKGWVHSRLLNLLEETRIIFDKPIIIESGYRCPKHNAEVGGIPDSAHLTGEAADIRCFFSADRFALLNILLDLGVKRIGIGKGILHVDISETMPQDLAWVYLDR